MSKYLYLATLERDPDTDGYTVTFPDLPGCITEGDDLLDATDMAQDALEGFLLVLEDGEEKIPAASNWETIMAQVESSSTMVVPVKADTRIARMRDNDRAVKKTLTIPNWLDELAKEKEINFSKVLQDALKELVGVSGPRR